jgi:hypothetical protein
VKPRVRGRRLRSAALTVEDYKSYEGKLIGNQLDLRNVGTKSRTIDSPHSMAIIWTGSDGDDYGARARIGSTFDTVLAPGDEAEGEILV